MYLSLAHGDRQEVVFEIVAIPLVENVLRYSNSFLIVCGPSVTGKTLTLEGKGHENVADDMW